MALCLQDAVVFGHSHKYVQEEKNGVWWLNPGSCGPRRFHQEITMMMAEITSKITSTT